MKHTLALLFFGLVLVGQSFAAGPFGFEKGMTVDQLTQILGKNALERSPGSSTIWKTAVAPKPHPAFEKYLLVISPTDGLVKVVAIGKTIETGDSGLELKSAHEEIVDAITAKYGPPKEALDGCNGGTGCSSSDMWMFSLYQKNRYLMTMWKPSGNNVSTIGVEATALRLNEGYINCSFEFDGFSKYADEQKAKQNDSF